jgi:hypothetical protein
LEIFLTLNSFLLITLFFLFGSTALPQWQVDGGKLIWPNGPVMPKTLLVYDDASSYQNALDLWTANSTEELPALIYKNTQNWRPALRLQIDVDSSHFTGLTHILGGISYAYLSTNHGVQLQPIIGFQGVGWSSISGSASYGAGSSLVGLIGSIYTDASLGSIPQAIGVHSLFSFETGANDTIINAFGFKSEINQWSAGSTQVDTFYSFYSSNDEPDNISKFYHFYGSGDYPSYFGGAAIQKVYTYNVHDPISSSDLESFIGLASEVGSGYTAYIDDNGEGIYFYQVVSDGTRWWVFIAAQAP